jgi:tRNA (cmo5U34)-methyltransferase
VSEQFHFDPDGYLAMIRDEVPAYDLMQDTVADIASEARADAILDLGTGTGETLRRVAARHPDARLIIGVDENPGMLAAARQSLETAELRVALLQDPLPEGRFDLVVSALAVHHLDGREKADLFRRIAARLAPDGRFVLADVIVPEDPADAITPLEPSYDQPSRIDELLQWLADSDMHATLRWRQHDIAIFVALSNSH